MLASEHLARGARVRCTAQFGARRIRSVSDSACGGPELPPSEGASTEFDIAGMRGAARGRCALATLFCVDVDLRAWCRRHTEAQGCKAPATLLARNPLTSGPESAAPAAR